jgi:glycosyltransferase involved in cell wall biosynthesis
VTLPSLSIITPSFNQARFLGQTIRSVLDQDYPSLEYLVMDGGSTDGSVEILESHRSRLRFVSERDEGQTAALNEGFRRTRGEIVAWINSDDLYARGALPAVGRFFAERPSVEWLYGRCPIIDVEGRTIRPLVTLYKELWARRYSYHRLLVENFIGQPAVFFRRRLLDRVGPLDPAYHFAMDYHLWLRMGEEAAPAFFDRELAFFRISGENKTSRSYRKSFSEELDAARRVAAGRHPLLMFLHAVNRVKLNTAYDLLAARPR